MINNIYYIIYYTRMSKYIYLMPYIYIYTYTYTCEEFNCFKLSICIFVTIEF